MRSKTPRKGTISWYKKKLDTIFSIYIRTKHSDCDGVVKCFTCGASKVIKKIQNGHFVSRQYLATRWEEDNCRPQCLTEESSLKCFDGTYKKISNLEIGDKLSAFNKTTFRNEISVVENITTFIPKELYRVELVDGSIFYSTGEHKVVSNNCWVTIKNISSDINVHNILEL